MTAYIIEFGKNVFSVMNRVDLALRRGAVHWHSDAAAACCCQLYCIQSWQGTLSTTERMA